MPYAGEFPPLPHTAMLLGIAAAVLPLPKSWRRYFGRERSCNLLDLLDKKRPAPPDVLMAHPHWDDASDPAHEVCDTCLFAALPSVRELHRQDIRRWIGWRLEPIRDFIVAMAKAGVRPHFSVVEGEHDDLHLKGGKIIIVEPPYGP